MGRCFPALLFSLVDHHNHNRHILKEVSFKVCEGEIVGIAGVDENGQKELAEIICGLRKATSGEIRMLGKDVTHATTRQLIEMGMSYIPADRRNQGLVMNFPSEKTILKPLQNHSLKRFMQKKLLINCKRPVKDTMSTRVEFPVKISRCNHKSVIGRECSKMTPF